MAATGGAGVLRRPPFGSNPVVGPRGGETQRRILAAALDVFAEVGFHEAGVEAITTRAGCSRPAFYQYFADKDDVFWMLADGVGQEMVALGERLRPVTPDADGVSALASWIEELVTLHGEHSPVFSAFQAASRDHDALARGSGGISERLGQSLLGAATGDQGVHGREDRTVLARCLVSVLLRCAFYAERMPSGVARPVLVEALAELVHRLLLGPLEGVNLRSTGAPPRRRRPDPRPLIAPSDHGRALRPAGERTRRRLLDAGARVLPARGYHDVRVDDIVEAAGVSHGSFYRYFEHKDDLFRILAGEAGLRMLDLLDAFPASGQGADLHRWTEDWFTTYESNGGVISTWQELHASDPDLVALSRDVAGAVLARLADVLAGRPFGDPGVDALAMLAVVERVPYSVYTLRFTEREEAVEAMVTIVRQGFLGLAGDERLGRS